MAEELVTVEVSREEWVEKDFKRIVGEYTCPAEEAKRLIRLSLAKLITKPKETPKTESVPELKKAPEEKSIDTPDTNEEDEKISTKTAEEYPDDTWRVPDIKKWLDDNKIEYQSTAKKNELLKLIPKQSA